MNRYFGKETVFTLFTNIGSVCGCSLAVLAGTILNKTPIREPALIAAWANFFMAMAGLIGTVGSQVVNILKVIKDHEDTTKDIVSDMLRIQECINKISIDIELLKENTDLEK